MADTLIDVQDLTFIYPDTPHPALNNINFKIKQGEFVGVTGPAGAGKSTLSLCFSGIIPHFQAGRVAGQVVINGRPVADIPNGDLARTVGSVFQDPEAQIVSFTVEEEIAFGMENLGFPRDLMMQRIDESLNMVGINHLRHNSTVALSGGQKQRVVIAAVLAMMPQILVLDEPASELDPLGSEEIFNTLAKLNKEHGITVILFEQRIDQLAGYLDRLLVLDRGNLIADGRPGEVLARPDVVSLGVKLPQVTEFALLLDGKLKEVPVTLQQGAELLQKRLGTGRV